MDKTIDHILVSCIFARQFWFRFLGQVNLHDLSPQPVAHSFIEWWRTASDTSGELTEKGLNSHIILGTWVLWNHKNMCVFDGISPSLPAILVQAEERYLWGLAGAKESPF